LFGSQEYLSLQLYRPELLGFLVIWSPQKGQGVSRLVLDEKNLDHPAHGFGEVRIVSEGLTKQGFRIPWASLRQPQFAQLCIGNGLLGASC